MCVTYVLHLAILAVLLPMAQNHDGKFTKANVPLWKQRACEKSQTQKANSHYTCDDKGDVKCLPGWQGDLCQVPMCRRGCDPMNGYCQRPGECRCRIGYTGELCDKCIPLPGCQHGDCTKPFECLCRPGWDGLFCTEPTCRKGCHNTRGYCEAPGECRCRLGWAGRNCSDCSVLPGCQHGTCSKPLECNCKPGYTGLLCQIPICNAECDKHHGYCKKPGECRCKVGWNGPKCDQCFPYPGCVNGSCEKPWECNCKPGWGGVLCDEALTYCKENPNICENGGKCVAVSREDGNYHCRCKLGYLGKNCEIVDEFLLTSTAAPRITPPPPLDLEDEEDYDANSAENLINKANKTTAQKQHNSKGHRIATKVTTKRRETPNLEISTESIEFITKTTTSEPLSDVTLAGSPNEELENIANISGEDIIGTATTRMMPSAQIPPMPVTINVNFNTKSNSATKKIRRKIHQNSKFMNNPPTNSSNNNGIRTEPNIINPGINFESQATNFQPTHSHLPIQVTQHHPTLQNGLTQATNVLPIQSPLPHNIPMQVTQQHPTLQNGLIPQATNFHSIQSPLPHNIPIQTTLQHPTLQSAPTTNFRPTQSTLPLNIPIQITQQHPTLQNGPTQVLTPQKNNQNYVVVTTSSNEEGEGGDDDDDECDDNEEECVYVTTNDTPSGIVVANSGISSPPMAVINTTPTIVPINRLDQQAYQPVVANVQKVPQNLQGDKPNYAVVTTTTNEDEDAGVEGEEEEEEDDGEEEEEDDGEEEECDDDDNDEECEYEDEEEEEL